MMCLQQRQQIHEQREQLQNDDAKPTVPASDHKELSQDDKDDEGTESPQNPEAGA
jgi:hypothetical protein